MLDLLRREIITLQIKMSPQIKYKNQDEKKKAKRENSRRWRKNHPGLTTKRVKEWREKNPEKAKENRRNWAKNNPEKNKISHINNLTKRRKAVGSFTLGEWELVKKQYGNTCPACNKPEPIIKLTVDHIIPLSKGGSNWIENIQPLCGPCNTRKFTKIIHYKPGNNHITD
jgi:5-methylcytosine-specific restriction endonuclease McrA